MRRFPTTAAVVLLLLRAGASPAQDVIPHAQSLEAIKAEPLFRDSPLVKIGRLSVVPLTEDQWHWFVD